MDDLTRPLGGPRQAADRPRELAPGDRVRDWVCVRKLASGGFGTVYEVKHARTGEPAALKLTHLHLVTSPSTIARFDREIRIVQSLQHPNVVQLIEAGFTEDGRPYLCMVMLDGEDLSVILKRERSLDARRALGVLEPVCEALTSAHELGIIHRDVKAANIMVCSDGRVVLLDFGIAKISDALAPELTATNQSLGTPSCMAPEQILGGRPDPRTDVYALGGLLFHMLTGSLPFQDPSPTMVQYLQLHGVRPRASRVSDSVSAGFDDVIVKAMAIEPSERFIDPRALLSATRAASRATTVSRALVVRDAVAILVTVTDLTAGTALDPRLFDDLESVLPGAERYLTERGFTLAFDLGSSSLLVAPFEGLGDPATIAHELFGWLAKREYRDPRVQIGVCCHRDDAPFMNEKVQPCALLAPTSWGMPATVNGVWMSKAVE